MRGAVCWAVVCWAVACWWVSCAVAQPADCPTLPTEGPSLPLAIDLARRSGGLGGQALVTVPLDAPHTDCHAPVGPTDVLRGAPGDLLRGPAPTER